MNRMFTAKYTDYLISLTGACVIAFGLGVVVGDAIANFGWLLILLGTVVHAFGMYRSHRAPR